MSETQPTRGSVLIVDDERGLADLYEMYLGDAYETRTVYDGDAALDAIDRTIDVLLLDRRMPGLSGDEVLVELDDRAYDPAVAMLTAIDPGEDILELRIDEYIVKPVDRTQLRAAVDGLLARQRYDGDVREYFAIASKRAALEATLREHELASNDAYAALKRNERAAKSEIDVESSEQLSAGDCAGFREF